MFVRRKKRMPSRRRECPFARIRAPESDLARKKRGYRRDTNLPRTLNPKSLIMFGKLPKKLRHSSSRRWFLTRSALPSLLRLLPVLFTHKDIISTVASLDQHSRSLCPRLAPRTFCLAAGSRQNETRRGQTHQEIFTIVSASIGSHPTASECEPQAWSPPLIRTPLLSLPTLLPQAMSSHKGHIHIVTSTLEPKQNYQIQLSCGTRS